MANAVKIRRDDSEMRDLCHVAHSTWSPDEADATARKPATAARFGISASSAGPDNTVSVVEA